MIFQTKHFRHIGAVFALFHSGSALSASLPIRDSRLWLQMPGIEYRDEKQKWDTEITTDGVKAEKSYSQSTTTIDSGGSPLIGGRFDDHAVAVGVSSLMYMYYVLPSLAVGGAIAIDHEKTDNQYLFNSSREKNTDSAISLGPTLTYWIELNDASALYAFSSLRVHSRKTNNDEDGTSSSNRSYTTKPSPSILGGIYYLNKLSENIAMESGVSFFFQKIESTNKRSEANGPTISSDQDSTFTRFRIGLFSLIFSI